MLYMLALGMHLVHSQVILIDHINITNIPKDRRSYGEEYLHEKRSNIRSYPDIVNFDDFLSQFVSKCCLIIVDNPRNIHLASMNGNPVISRSIEPLSLRTAANIHYRVMYGPENFAPRNITLAPRGVLKCPFSKHFKNVDLYSGDLCYNLDMNNFWKNSKPWNCQINIYIYPPTLYYQGYGRMDTEEDILQEYRYLGPFPHLYIPPIRIFIQKEHLDTELKKAENNNLELLQTILLSMHWTDKYCRQVFLILTLVMLNNHFKPGLDFEPPKGVIRQGNVMKTCSHWIDHRNPFVVSLAEMSDFYKLLKTALPQNSAHLVWKVQGDTEEDSIIGKVQHFLLACDKLTSSSEVTFFSSPLDTIANAYAHIWLSIMDNYTIERPIGSPFHVHCTKVSNTESQSGLAMSTNLELNFRSYLQGAYLFPFFFEEELSSLRFVSCGNRGLAGIAFAELTSIFDTWTWLLIIASTSTVAISFHTIPELKADRFIHWLSSLQVLLEQGAPHLDSVAKVTRTKLTIGAFILMGVVLSNAYKNSNVYNMITPRKPIPYHFFDELRRDGFQIYSRISSTMVTNMPEDTVTQYLIPYIETSGNESVKILEVEGGFIVAVSEVSTLLFQSSKMASRYPQHMNFLSLSILKYGTQVSDHITEFLLRTLYSLFKRSASISDVFYTYADKNKTNEIMATDAKGLFFQLKQCNKVALVLPEYLCRRYLRDLKKEENEVHAFIGKETYLGLKWMFTLNGALPPHLPQRIKGIHEGGIWSRWVVMQRENITTENQIVAAARMDGNIILIFLVWIFGIILSTVFVVAEYFLCNSAQCFKSYSCYSKFKCILINCRL